MTDRSNFAANDGLPDPNTQAYFYQGVAGKRAMAWLVDLALILALCLIILPFTGFLALFFFGALFLFVGFLYRWTSIARHSATPGMRLMGIEFRNAQGLQFDSGTAFVHTLGYSLSVALCVPQLISIALMLLTPRGQSLTDHILGTAAIHRPM